MQPILTVDLDRIAAGRAGMVVLNGKQHAVAPIGAASLQLIRTALPVDQIPVSLTVISRCIPTLSEEERDALIPEQIEAVLALITGDVDAVAKLDPNADRPAPAMPSLSPV